MSSWGHYIVSASQHQRERAWGCSGPMCRAPVVYRTGYQYITGRKGRVGVAEKFLCEAHGEKFARKYKLAMPGDEIPTSNEGARAERAAFVKAAIQAADDGDTE